MDFANQAYQEFSQKPLEKQMTPQELEGEVNRFWDGVMVRVTAATTDSNIRNAYRILLRQARTQSLLLQWQGQPEVFYSTTAADHGKKKLPWWGIAGAVVLAGLGIWLAMPRKDSIIWPAVAAAVALVLVVIQGILLWKAVPAAPTVNVRTEARIDPDRVRSGLRQMTLELDAHADALCAMLAEAEPQAGMPDISLAQELLRLPVDRRDPTVVELVDRYLVRQGVEKVEYSPQRQELFMVLPGPREMTVEPALVRDGQLLHMGVACVVMEG